MTKQTHVVHSINSTLIASVFTIVIGLIGLILLPGCGSDSSAGSNRDEPPTDKQVLVVIDGIQCRASYSLAIDTIHLENDYTVINALFDGSKTTN